MKWIPIFHQMTEIREKLDSIYKVDNQWKYRPRKEGFKIYAAKIYYFWNLFFCKQFWNQHQSTDFTEEISKEEDTFESQIDSDKEKSSEELPSLDDADDEEEYDEIGDEEVDFNSDVPEKGWFQNLLSENFYSVQFLVVLSLFEASKMFF